MTHVLGKNIEKMDTLVKKMLKDAFLKKINIKRCIS